MPKLYKVGCATSSGSRKQARDQCCTSSLIVKLTWLHIAGRAGPDFLVARCGTKI